MVTLPKGYMVKRHELEGDVPRVRFDVIQTEGARLVGSVRVRLWAGEWWIQSHPTAGVPITADVAQAMAYALNEAAQSARRGNEGGRP